LGHTHLLLLFKCRAVQAHGRDQDVRHASDKWWRNPVLPANVLGEGHENVVGDEDEKAVDDTENFPSAPA